MSETRRYFIHLSYLGKNYHGWQIQPNAITVQECIETALSTILSDKIAIVGCGRTDTGVHARSYYAHFDSNIEINNSDLKFKLNGFLKNDIAIHDILNVDKECHARFDAISRSYIYRMHCEKNVFNYERSYYIRTALNFDSMNSACLLLLQYEDFSCFAKSNTQVSTNNCDISVARWIIKDNKSMEFQITANRFLRGMVRAIVGTLIEVGEGKRTLENFKQVIENKDRTKAGPSAPAKGLYLDKINYEFL